MERNAHAASRQHRARRGAITIASVAMLWAIVLGAGAARASSSDRASTTPPASQFTIGDTSRAFPGVWRVREWTYTAARGSSPFDRIALHRVTRGLHPPAHPNIVMLYLPGTNMNGEVTVTDARNSLPIFMAAHGVDFWALDYRTHFIPPTTPQSHLAELKRWTSDLFESDIAAAADFVMKTTGRERIYVAGFSRGASFAYLYAARHPREVQGLVIFDGWIPPDRQAGPAPRRYADDVGGAHLTYDKRRALLDAVIANPDGPAPLPRYKSARANLEAVVYGAGGAFGGHGGLANPQGGFSDAVVLARMLAGYDRYWPAIQDAENPFTASDRARLAASQVPVIAFASTNISPQWPERVAQSAAATGSGGATVKKLAGWGHLDVICGTQAEAQVFMPVLSFLRLHRK